jgi:uncharacterized membrane protein YhaH (DUF805 family)
MIGVHILLTAALPIEWFVRPVPLDAAIADPWSTLTPLSIFLFVAPDSVAITVGAKRFHDRNRTGWLLLLFVIPILGIFVVIELGFLRGTRGPNRFGPDPLDRRLLAAA